MPEIQEDAGLLPTDVAPKVAIGVSKGPRGLRILKLALEKEVTADGLVYLIHVLSPVRRIPSALGAKFHVEQVHPEIVENYRKYRILQRQKLLDQYQRVCDKKKVQSIVCYSESDSVSKELVSQTSRFGITKLILGISSTSLLARALKKDSISTYVVKNAPRFCTVMVVNKGKLCSVKNAAPVPMLRCGSPSSGDDSGLSIVSETICGSDDGFEGDSRISFQQEEEENTWFEVQDDISNSPSVLSDCSITSSQWALYFGRSSNGDCQGPPIDVSMASEVELLQNQLSEARLWAKKARTEADRQSRKVEAVLENAKKKVMEHERHRFEALTKAKCAMQKATRDANRCREALAALEVAMQDYEKINRRLTEEVSRHLETQMELAMQRIRTDVYAYEAACAKDLAEAERRRCEETVMKLKDMARKVEVECQLRREAEEIASQEATAKLAALTALGKTQHRYFEYSFQELQAATNDFNEENKIGEGRYGWVYKGRLHHTLVAIKVLAPHMQHSPQDFQREVELLSGICHPHMLLLLGACPERGCIVYELMANGNLEDRLNRKDGTPPLPWYIRFRVCLEVATALLFLHSQPKPIVHRDLKPAKILLDRNFVSKIADVGLARVLPHNLSFSETHYEDSVPVGTVAYIDPDYQRTGVESCECDVYALGVVLLQLLTGKPAIGVVDLVEAAERSGKLVKILDPSAGDWPLQETAKLALISLRCTTTRRDRAKLEVDILPVLESIQVVAGVAAANMAYMRPHSPSTRLVIPSFFFCPILQDIMEDPFIAADGFTYEYDAIKVWLQTNNTSPMTNLRLDNKNLTPNYTLRSVMREWSDQGLI